MNKGPPRLPEAALHIVDTAMRIGDRNLKVRRRWLGADPGFEAPGPAHLRLMTMRHWITSFQLFDRDAQCRATRGLVNRAKWTKVADA